MELSTPQLSSAAHNCQSISGIWTQYGFQDQSFYLKQLTGAAENKKQTMKLWAVKPKTWPEGEQNTLKR